MEDKYAVRAVVGTEPKVNRIRKGLTLVKCTIYDETGTLNVTYFNNPYAAAQLRVGQEYVFYGKVQGFGRGRTMVSPQSEKVAPDADHPGRIVPVYPLTAGLTQRDLERVTAAALDTLTGEWPDALPELLRAKYRLPDAVDALSAIHRPKTKDDMAQARRRMVFEELFLLCCGLQQLKERRKAIPALFSPRMDWIRSLKPCRLHRPAHSGVRLWRSRQTRLRTADEPAGAG